MVIPGTWWYYVLLPITLFMHEFPAMAQSNQPPPQNEIVHTIQTTYTTQFLHDALNNSPEKIAVEFIEPIKIGQQTAKVALQNRHTLEDPDLEHHYFHIEFLDIMQILLTRPS